MNLLKDGGQLFSLDSFNVLTFSYSPSRLRIHVQVVMGDKNMCCAAVQTVSFLSCRACVVQTCYSYLFNICHIVLVIGVLHGILSTIFPMFKNMSPYHDE
jgi:hypothetical protein